MTDLWRAFILTIALISAHSLQSAAFRAVSAITDPEGESCAPPNGAIDPGETNNVAFTFKNTTGTAIKAVKVNLRSDVNDVAFAVNGAQSVGDVAKDETFTVTFRLRADGICGGTLSPRFAVEGREADDTPFSDVDIEPTDSHKFDFQLGVTIESAYVFTAPNPIKINDFLSDADPSRNNGRAAPFPSVVSAANVPHLEGRTGERVSNVTVTFNRFSHGYTADLGVVLESPNGQKNLLLRNSGGRVFPIDTEASDLTFSLDSAASQDLPFSRQILAGSFKPADYGSGDLIPGASPTGPYATSLTVLRGPAAGTAATESDIIGSNPNGDWKLYVVDNAPGESGISAGGWTLEITTSKIVCCGAGHTFPTIIFGDGFGTSDGTGETPETVPDDPQITEGNDDSPPIPENTPPTISITGNLSIFENTASSAIPFTVDDTETFAGELAIAATSSDPTLVPNTNVLIAGDGANRSVIIVPVPNSFGDVFLTLTVTDPDGSSASATLNLTVLKEREKPNPPGDLNSDGHSDLVFQNESGFLAAWLLEGVALRSAIFLSPDHIESPLFNVVATGDFNRDKSSDIVFQKDDGTIAVWFMQGTSQAQTGVIIPDNPGDASWRIKAVDDLNKDGHDDFIFQHFNGSLAAWLMDGVRLQTATLFSPSRAGVEWEISGTGDFNEDGSSDLLFQHMNGSLAVWFLDETTLVQAALLKPSRPNDSNWRVVSAADRNQDGKPDLLFQHASDGTLAIWFMDGIELVSAQLLSPSTPGGTWKVAAP